MKYESFTDSGGRYTLLDAGIDESDIQLIENAGKTTIRTIKDYSLSSEYNKCIDAFCFNRNEHRTFNIVDGRIKWIEVLDLKFNRTAIDDPPADDDDLPF